MRYLVGLVMLILIAIVAMILLLGGNGGKNSATTPSSTPNPVLTDYIDAESSVSMLVDGKINSEDAHRSIKITVSATNRTVDVIKGYDGTVEKTASYGNTPEAYDAFMRAVANAGFMTKLKNPTQTDDRGVCATGKRYIYSLLDKGVEVSRLWGTSCSVKIGTFAGNGPLTRSLFQAQIPDYNKFVSGITL